MATRRKRTMLIRPLDLNNSIKKNVKNLLDAVLDGSKDPME
jgi:hypothetical protein